jgi:hypothetical protein
MLGHRGAKLNQNLPGPLLIGIHEEDEVTHRVAGAADGAHHPDRVGWGGRTPAPAATRHSGSTYPREWKGLVRMAQPALLRWSITDRGERLLG